MPDILSPAELAAIAARERSATPGPWGIDFYGIYSKTAEKGHVVSTIGERSLQPEIEINCSADDRAFIAHARADIPALLASHAALVKARDSALEDARVLAEAVSKLAALNDAIGEFDMAPDEDDEHGAIKLVSKNGDNKELTKLLNVIMHLPSKDQLARALDIAGKYGSKK